MCDTDKWEVIGSINGYCTYHKDNLTKDEVGEFMGYILDHDGRIMYRWADDTLLFLPNLDTCAFWARKMK